METPQKKGYFPKETSLLVIELEAEPVPTSTCLFLSEEI